MLFNSLEFLLLFLPASLIAAWTLRRTGLLVHLCLASAVFYALAGHVWFLAPMLFTATLDWWVALRMEATTSSWGRRAYLLASLTANLGLLAFFKYVPLIARTGRELATTLGLAVDLAVPPAFAWVILPAGISFYTFQTISYIVDVYRRHGRAQRDYFAYLAFVTFFPHLVAGPLTRHDQLIPQLLAVARDGIHRHRRFAAGIYLFSVGLAKKVLLADRIADFSDPLIARVGDLGAVEAWMALLGYALQIYFDFSGYSDMAVGLGRLFGIELPQNFDSPYQSHSPQDFWRRWHISLSRWLRDYLYVSLGGNRCEPTRARLNLIVTMFLGGLWHGASWTFAVWGLYHGGLLAVHAATAPRWGRLPVSVQRALTFLLVTLGWVLFRAPDFGTAMEWYAALLGVRGLGSIVVSHAFVILILLGLGIATFGRNTSQIDFEAASPVQAAAMGLVFAAALLWMTHSSRFLYFQF